MRREIKDKFKKVSAMVITGVIMLSCIPANSLNFVSAAQAQNVVKIQPWEASTFNDTNGDGFGEFEGWGTSIAWWGNRNGYSEKMTEEAATAFYSDDGLDLNIARYNIGGGDFVDGSTQDSQDFLHDPHVVRSDSVVPGYATDVTNTDATANGIEYYEENYDQYDLECGYAWNYDWDADANQINTLMAAAEASGEDFIAEYFSNTPPYFMTVSGCSSGAVNPWDDNLREDSYRAFALYLADVLEYWMSQGVDFNAITPMNEPNTGYWRAYSEKQEGCHISPGEAQSMVYIELNKVLEERGIDITIAGTGETSIDTAISSYNALYDEAKDIIDRIDTHTYGGSNREGLKNVAETEDKGLWMAEVDGRYLAGTNAGEMTAPLGFATQIMKDIHGMNVSAWVMWDAAGMHVDSSCEFAGTNGADFSSMEQWGNSYSDETGMWGIAVSNHNTEEIVLTKKYYGYGQFTRYIRPGYSIIGSSDNTLAAYDPDNNKVVIVAMNTNAQDEEYKFDLSSFTTMGDNITAIRTSGTLENGENWADVSSAGDITANTEELYFTSTLKSNSITTYIIEGVDFDPNKEEIISVEDVHLFTVNGMTPILPRTITAETSIGTVVETDVVWNTIGVDYSSATTLSGLANNGKLPVSATINHVTPNLVYFIDANNQNSTTHGAIEEQFDLMNDVPDKSFDGDWGYMSEYGVYNGNMYNPYSSGWYADQNEAIEYTVQLDAGTYNAGFGFTEWWSSWTKSRPITATVTQNGEILAQGETNTVNGEVFNNFDSFEFTCETGEVTLSVVQKAGSSHAATIAFIEISKALNTNELQEAIKEADMKNADAYTDEVWGGVELALIEAKSVMLTSTATQNQIDEATKNLLNELSVLDNIEIVDKIEEVKIYTVSGVKQLLPKTVTVTTNKGNTEDKPVTWNLENYNWLDSKIIYGTIEGVILEATAHIEILSENMVYFIDCNNLNSETYQEIDLYANLLNETPDKLYEEGSWGRLHEYGAYTGNESDPYSSGWWSKNTEEQIAYNLPLEEGVYEISLGIREWWTGPRPMDVIATQNGVSTKLGETDSYSENGSKTNFVTFEYTSTSASDVTISLEAHGRELPTLAFMQVQKMLSLGELKETVNNAKGLDTSGYQAEKVEVLNNAIALAEKLMVTASSTQGEVDNSVQEILSAIENLTTVDKTELQELLAEINEFDFSKYTASSKISFETEIDEARNVAEDVMENTSAEETEISSAINALSVAFENAKQKLVTIKSVLEAGINTYSIPAGDAEKYTAESYEVYSNALSEANNLKAKEDLTEIEVNEAVEILKNAKENLVEDVTVDKNELKALIEKSEKYKQSDYKISAWIDFALTLNCAKEVYELEEATQIQVNNSVSGLECAIGELEKNKIVEDSTYDKVVKYVNKVINTIFGWFSW